jgi:HSP20 family molecular chaperone IbpA
MIPEHEIDAPVGALFRDSLRNPLLRYYLQWRVDLVQDSTKNMKTRHYRNLSSLIAVGSLLAVSSACSKTEPSSAVATSTPTATVTESTSSAAGAVPTISPLPTGSPFADVQLRMRDLQSQMDNVFAETFRDLGTSFGQTGFASSVDLREQKDGYVARIYLPNGDTSKVNAKINDGNLDITMNGSQTKNGTSETENYEQTITLPQPVRADQMQIQRKPNMVVISVPKANPTAVSQNSPVENSSPNALASASPSSVAESWDQRMIGDMRQMETRMDQMFHNAFPNDMFGGPNALRLGSSVNIEDQKDKYVVHFALPQQDISNVNVNLENGELHLSAREQKNTSSNGASGTAQSVERGRFEEMITLPGPVKEDQMKINRQANAVVVTLPKA